MKRLAAPVAAAQNLPEGLGETLRGAACVNGLGLKVAASTRW
jgi:hypothetical protein